MDESSRGKAASRNVLLTGGSRGLGLAIAQRLARCGYQVIAVARQRRKELLAAIAELETSQQSSLRFVPFDLGEVTKIPELVRQLRKEFGPIFGLVNNAALGSDGALAMMPYSLIDQLIRINTVSPIVLTKYVSRGMMSDGGGRIVNVASIVATTGYSGLLVYGASKASMIGFTRSLARELGADSAGIHA